MTKKPEVEVIIGRPGVGDTGDVSYREDAATGWRYYSVRTPEFVRRARGKPIVKDWIDVLHWLVAEAAKNGLPQGRGGKAEVARWIDQWFINHDLDTSEGVSTEIKKHVRAIYEEFEKVANSDAD